MNARVETYSGATNLLGAATFLQGSVLAELRLEPGYLGGMASIDESGGVLGLISLWDDAAALKASDHTARGLRDALVRLGAGDATVEGFAQVRSEVGHPPPEAGCPVRFLRFRLGPSRRDESIDFLASDVLPSIAAARGFRAVRTFTDVGAGQGLTVIILSDEDAVSVSEADFLQRRADHAAHGIRFISSTQRRVVLVDRHQPSPLRRA
jgi:hypothetical protein